MGAARYIQHGGTIPSNRPRQNLLFNQNQGADALAPLRQNVDAASGMLQYNLGRSPGDEALKARNATSAGVYNMMETADPNVSNSNALRARIQGAGLISAGSQAGYDSAVASRNQGLLQSTSALAGANESLAGGLFRQNALDLTAREKLQAELDAQNSYSRGGDGTIYGGESTSSQPSSGGGNKMATAGSVTGGASETDLSKSPSGRLAKAIAERDKNKRPQVGGI